MLVQRNKKINFLVRLVSRFSLSHVGSEGKNSFIFRLLSRFTLSYVGTDEKKFYYSVPCWCREIKIHLFVATN